MSEQDKKIRVGITHGDFNGIGYEVILKALARPEILELFTPVIFGSSEVAARTVSRLGLEDFRFFTLQGTDEIKDGRINLIDVCGEGVRQTLGLPSPEGGKAAATALEAAVEAAKSGVIDVLVTAPIDKMSIQSEGFRFPGHTEFLEDRLKAPDGSATMIMAADNLRVALVTTHMALSEVPMHITKEAVEEAIRNFNTALKKDFACERPKIAVLSLNPHSGDAGLLGIEEIERITPAIKACQEEGILAMGPFAADGLFGNGAYASYDGILAMYHDQGLAPFKALAREKGVNFTAGLELVRTSPAHGTAYDKAGQGTADETSMREAIYMAIDILRRRKTYEEAAADPLVINEQKYRDQRRGKPGKQTIEEPDDEMPEDNDNRESQL